ncbi:GtrA family protein [Marinobacter sp.]|uniref:GtrA family protein n=1 Tax=Marinobacter sp. TaxID=50741 RepID=UPI00387EC5F0
MSIKSSFRTFDLRTALRYLLIGGSSVVIYIGLLAALIHAFSYSDFYANALAYLVATTFNYLLNYYWSFRATRNHFDAIWRFAMIAGGGVVLNSAFVMSLVSLGIQPEWAALVFAALWPFASFLLMKFWAFT